MIRPDFLSPEDRLELLACVKSQREEHGIARRANALLLLDAGKSCVEIASVLCLDSDTVRGWRKQYLAAGWDWVAHDDWKGGQSRMTQAQEPGSQSFSLREKVGVPEQTLCAWLEGRFCRGTAEITAYIGANLEIKSQTTSESSQTGIFGFPGERSIGLSL